MLSEERSSRVWSILMAHNCQLLNVLVQKSFTYKYLESIIKLFVMQAKYIKTHLLFNGRPIVCSTNFLPTGILNDRLVGKKGNFFYLYFSFSFGSRIYGQTPSPTKTDFTCSCPWKHLYKPLVRIRLNGKRE